MEDLLDTHIGMPYTYYYEAMEQRLRSAFQRRSLPVVILTEADRRTIGYYIQAELLAWHAVNMYAVPFTFGGYALYFAHDKFEVATLHEAIYAEYPMLVQLMYAPTAKNLDEAFHQLPSHATMHEKKVGMPFYIGEQLMKKARVIA